MDNPMPPPVTTGGLPFFGQMGLLLREAAVGQWATTRLQSSLTPHLPVMQALGESGVFPREIDFLRQVAEGRRTAIAPERLGLIADRFAAVDEIAGVDEGLLEQFRAIAEAAPALAQPLFRPEWAGPVAVRLAGTEEHILCPAAHCGATNEPSHKFCRECGTAMLVRPTVRDNRVATMVFTDLKGFSAFSERLPADQLYPLMGEVLAGLTQAVTSEGGFVSGYWGDAVYAIFGAPQAHEDDPVRACRAAVKMQEFMRSWNERRRGHGQPILEIRVGMNTGRVAWGPLRPPGREEIWTAFGNAVNVAARLEPLAKFEEPDPATGKGVERGGIAVSRATVDRLAGRFEVERVGEVTVKNIEQPVEYFRLVRERLSVAGLAPRGTEQVTFAGRGDELALLTGEFDAVVADRTPRLTVVSGEAGLGKSRLGAEFLTALGASGREIALVTVHGESVGGQTPYSGIAAAIRDWAGIEEGMAVGEARERLQALVQTSIAESPEELGRHLLLLGNLIGIAPESVPPGMEHLFRDAVELRERTRDSVVTLFDHVSRRRPIMLVLEDLHWIDRGTLVYVETLLERLKGRPLFCLGLTRPRFADSSPSLMTSKSYPVRRVDLGQLPDAVLTSMVREILGDREIDDESIGFLIAQSGRNPYLVQERARSVREGWRIERETVTGGLRFVSPDGSPVPAGAEAFLQARVDVLPAGHQAFLRAASVIGMELSVAEVVALGVKGAGEFVDELVRRKALVSTEEGTLQFPHALSRDAIYAGIPADRRQALHKERGRYLIEKRPAEFALIASHLANGNEPRQSAEYYLKAARDAADNRAAYVTAAEFAEGAYRQAEQVRDQERQLEALLVWDEALFMAGVYDQLEGVHRLALDLIDRMPGVAVGQRAEVHYRVGRTMNRRSQATEGERHLRGALDLVAGRVGTEALRSATLAQLGANRVIVGQYAEAQRAYGESLEIARGVGDKRQVAQTLMGVAYVQLKLGNQSEVIRAYEEARRIFEEFGDVPRIIEVLTGIGSALMNLGDYGAAESTLREAEEHSRRYKGKVRGLVYLFPTLGAVLYLQGRAEETIRLLEGYLIENSNHSNVIYHMAYLALSYLATDRLADAEIMVGRALETAVARHSPDGEAVAQVVRAEIHRARGNLAEALRASEVAVERFGELGGVEEFDLEILLTHAQILAESGKTQEAWETIVRAKRILDERASSLREEAHRRSFMSRVRVNREIVQFWQVLKARIEEGEMRIPEAVTRQLVFFPPSELPADLRFVSLERPGEISREETDHDAAAGTVVDAPLLSVLSSLLTREVVVPRNDGEFENVWAENVRWRPFWGRDGNPYVSLAWDLRSSLPGPLQRMVLSFVRQPARYEELFGGRVVSRDGIVHIGLGRGEQVSVESSSGVVVGISPDLRVRPHQFGRLRFSLVPNERDQTILVLRLEKALFTQNPWTLLEAFLRVIRRG